jgi:hypothetical protein
MFVSVVTLLAGLSSWPANVAPTARTPTRQRVIAAKMCGTGGTLASFDAVARWLVQQLLLLVGT